jgi:hypothetical protein
MPSDSTRPPPPFTEPNLAFSLHDRTSDLIAIRTHFSLEARPPWLSGEDQPDLFDYFITTQMPPSAIIRAADDWNHQLNEFPERLTTPAPTHRAAPRSPRPAEPAQNKYARLPVFTAGTGSGTRGLSAARAASVAGRGGR